MMPPEFPLLDYHGSHRPAVQPDRHRAVGSGQLQPCIFVPIEARRGARGKIPSKRPIGFCDRLDPRIRSACRCGIIFSTGSTVRRSRLRGIRGWRRGRESRFWCGLSKETGEQNLSRLRGSAHYFRFSNADRSRRRGLHRRARRSVVRGVYCFAAHAHSQRLHLGSVGRI